MFIHFVSANSFSLSEVLHGSEKHHLNERQELRKNKPHVDHPDVRGGGQALHLADEDGRHDKHGGQVHAEGGLEEEGLEEGGGVGDGDQQKRWKVGCHHLTYGQSIKQSSN